VSYKPAVVKTEPFTNEKGQVINPGDQVIYVTVGTGRVRVGTGQYVGFRESVSYYNGGTNKSVVIDANKEKNVPVDADGNDCDYSGDTWRNGGYKWRKQKYIRRVALQNNRVYPLNTSALDMSF
jgi:hypothetical protein